MSAPHRQPPEPEDPRDATIRRLRTEVERLAAALDQIGEECEIRIATREAAQARALLARLAGGSNA